MSGSRICTFFLTMTLVCGVLMLGGCKKKAFNTQDVDPGQAGRVRSLGPESQDVLRVSEMMMRSLSADPAISEASLPPTIVMLPLENNTRFPFNPGVFTTRLQAQLNRDAKGQMRFVDRGIYEDILREREGKRAGEFDYDPNRRTVATAGADFFLKGYVEGLSAASREGMSEYAVYSFSLVDTETGIVLWQDLFDVKREGRDDVLYR
jgi:PBP1b-binding outer membrane lipoprotein LpoB